MFARRWSQFVDCVKRYTDRCFTEARRQEFNKAVESPVDSVHQMCTVTTYQTGENSNLNCSLCWTVWTLNLEANHWKLFTNQRGVISQKSWIFINSSKFIVPCNWILDYRWQNINILKIFQYFDIQVNDYCFPKSFPFVVLLLSKLHMK